jgi:hypothetical protein
MRFTRHELRLLHAALGYASMATTDYAINRVAETAANPVKYRRQQGLRHRQFDQLEHRLGCHLWPRVYGDHR